MALDVVKNYQYATQSINEMLRLILYKGEVFRLPASFKEVQVLSGLAWLTINGKDILLEQGQKIALSSKEDFALVSAMRDMPLVLEARGANPCL
jgi:hypothetical protein